MENIRIICKIIFTSKFLGWHRTDSKWRQLRKNFYVFVMYCMTFWSNSNFLTEKKMIMVAFQMLNGIRFPKIWRASWNTYLGILYEKITHMWRRLGTPQNFLLEKPKNQKFEKMKKNCRRYHHFTHVYQKKESYDVQFLRYGVRQRFFCHFGPFLPFTSASTPTPLDCSKPKVSKNETFIWRCHHFKLVQQETRQMMYAYSDMELPF